MTDIAVRGLTRVLALAIAAALLTSACASAGAPAGTTTRPAESVSVPPKTATPTPTTPIDDKTVSVQLGEHFFDPSAIKVKVGTTVTWRNNGQQTHDLHAYDGSFDSPPLAPGNTFTFTFTKPGFFRYYCIPHEGDGMTGQVQVE